MRWNGCPPRLTRRGHSRGRRILWLRIVIRQGIRKRSSCMVQSRTLPFTCSVRTSLCLSGCSQQCLWVEPINGGRVERRPRPVSGRSGRSGPICRRKAVVAFFDPTAIGRGVMSASCLHLCDPHLRLNSPAPPVPAPTPPPPTGHSRVAGPGPPPVQRWSTAANRGQPRPTRPP